MEIKSFEVCRLVHLTQFTRKTGQLYLPDAARKMFARYSFAKGPASYDELIGETVTFRHGKFNDAAVDEMSIYNDGIIVTSRSDTSFLDSFAADLFGWLASEFALVEVRVMRPNVFYDSALVVSSDKSLDKSLRKFDAISKLLAAKLKAYGAEEEYAYQPAAISLDGDWTKLPGGRKPYRFSFERRAGVPFDANLYYSAAPLKTADHLEALQALEAIL